ncbi:MULTISPECIES: ABC transporter ATP-binding protein [unclassified Xanthobacter]|uniref:ABC transporter ATP-binding protein n=1 Tax=unclassified Xanthobacter TaxID=2623496 RepID=UPI001F3F0982|nr:MULTISPECIES: ABC transporter ATP-binding protein [unclassified Xanthobacter]
MARIEIDGIEKRFGRTPVLRGIDLDVRAGEFLSLVGPSGCGKSTLLRIIAGLTREDRGTIRLAGASVDQLPARDRDFAMVFQNYALYPHLTVAENIAVPLVMRRLTAAQRLPFVGRHLAGSRAARAAIEADVTRVAETLGITKLAHRRPGELSGGQRQRVALGRAMVRRPKAFLMDEPLSNLDAKLRVEMRAEIASLHHRLETTFVYVTHDQAEAMTMSDRIAVMMDGTILQIGTPDEVYADPDTLSVAEFVGSPKINVIAADADLATALGLDIGRVPDPQGLRLAFRAEAVELVEAAGAQLSGSIVHLENFGSDLMVHVATATATAPLLVRRDPHDPRPRIGETWGLSIRPDRLLAFDKAGRRLRSVVGGRA